MTDGVAEHSIAVIGGGFAGSLLSLKLAKAGVHPVLIDPAPQAGPGLAYGAADATHVLNVPVQRMEVGLTPGFTEWLAAYPDDIAEAVAEAGDLAQAFVPRRLFGRYLAEQIDAAVRDGSLTRLRGEVVKVDRAPSGIYSLGLSDGRWVKAARVILAAGNLAPKAPQLAGNEGPGLEDLARFIADPWRAAALDAIAADDEVMLIGTGLTMVDVALSLRARGHVGKIHTVSRHGLLPHVHQAGGAWPAFLGDHAGRSPLYVLRVLRAEAAAAAQDSVPWQRVIDAARPAVAQIWSRWDRKQRAQFLRHGRALWDIHRHRVAPRIGAAVQGLLADDRFNIVAGRLVEVQHDGARLRVTVRRRHEHDRHDILGDHIINCTGPRTDFATLGTPLFADLRCHGLIQPDRLGLGIETSDAHVTDAKGVVSESLFAVGSLTRPAWWEVTAVPEIAAQVTRLAQALTRAVDAPRQPAVDRVFDDLGAGI